MYFDEWKNPIVIATLALAIITLFMVIAAYRSIRQNRRIREQDSRLLNINRRLGDVERWIDEVLQLRASAAGPPGGDVERRQRATSARVLASKAKYIKSIAKRVDSEFAPQISIENHVARLEHIIGNADSYGSLGDRNIVEVEDKCIDIVKTLNDIKDKV